jgi:7-cyano-7-deazaguanine synthase
MDSTVALFAHASKIRLAISFNYGSKHNDREIAMAALNCKQLGIEHRIVKLDLDQLGFVSSLLQSGEEVPEGHYESENMKSTVVPFRNGIMLSIAAGLAESLGCDKVMISNHGGDHAIYPDCREEFIDVMNKAIGFGTYNNTQILAPYTHFSKREIAIIGKALHVPFEHTYSCYKGGELHCGKCGTCTERKEALEGFDNTIYCY